MCDQPTGNAKCLENFRVTNSSKLLTHYFPAGLQLGDISTEFRLNNNIRIFLFHFYWINALIFIFAIC